MSPLAVIFLIFQFIFHKEEILANKIPEQDTIQGLDCVQVIPKGTPRFVFDTKKVRDLVYAVQEPKVKDEVLAQELEKVTRETEAKEALISSQKQCIVELGFQLRQEHDQGHARRQRNINWTDV
jgi:hypothetical protein